MAPGWATEESTEEEISNYINEMNIMSYRFKKINNQYYLNNIK